MEKQNNTQFLNKKSAQFSKILALGFLLLGLTSIWAQDLSVSFYEDRSSESELLRLNYKIIDSTKVECIWEQSQAAAKVDSLKRTKTKVEVALNIQDWQTIQSILTPTNLKEIQGKHKGKDASCGPLKEWTITKAEKKYTVSMDRCALKWNGKGGAKAAKAEKIRNFFMAFESIENSCAVE